MPEALAQPRAAGALPTILAACLTLIFAAGATAQVPQPVETRRGSAPAFLSRYDFHMTAYGLVHDPPPTDQRFSWDTHFGGSLDFVDYVVGRTSLLVDYEAVLGSEFRPFDPNQGNYILEAATSVRVGGAELVGAFHHVSRHLSDRPKRPAIAWNALIGRILKRVQVASTTVDIDLEGGRLVQHSFVDYTWTGELHLRVRHPVTPRAGVFAHAWGQVFGVDGTVPKRGRQTGGLIEAGLRLTGDHGVLELFAGVERRLDGYPLDRVRQQWGLAGFRLLSR